MDLDIMKIAHFAGCFAIYISGMVGALAIITAGCYLVATSIIAGVRSELDR